MKKLSEQVAELESNFDFYYNENRNISSKYIELENNNKVLKEDAAFLSETMRYWHDRATYYFLAFVVTWLSFFIGFMSWLTFCPTAQQSRNYLESLIW